MKPNTALFIGFLFFDVAALAWGAWEVWSARETKPKPGEADARTQKEGPAGGEAPPGPSPGLSGHPEG